MGLLAPFGRFFNNTVAFSMFMSDVSARSVCKALPASQTRSAKEIAVRGAIGMGFLATMIQDEEYIRNRTRTSLIKL